MFDVNLRWEKFDLFILKYDFWTALFLQCNQERENQVKGEQCYKKTDGVNER